MNPAHRFPDEISYGRAVVLTANSLASLRMVRESAAGEKTTRQGWQSGQFSGETADGQIKLNADIDQDVIRIRVRPPIGTTLGPPFSVSGTIHLAALEGPALSDTAKIVNFLDAASAAVDARLIGHGLPRPLGDADTLQKLDLALAAAPGDRRSGTYTFETSVTMLDALMPRPDPKAPPFPPNLSDLHREARTLGLRSGLIASEVIRSAGTFAREEQRVFLEKAVAAVDAVLEAHGPSAREVVQGNSLPWQARFDVLQSVISARAVSSRLHQAVATYGLDEAPQPMRGP